MLRTKWCQQFHKFPTMPPSRSFNVPPGFRQRDFNNAKKPTADGLPLITLNDKNQSHWPGRPQILQIRTNCKWSYAQTMLSNWQLSFVGWCMWWQRWSMHYLCVSLSAEYYRTRKMEMFKELTTFSKWNIRPFLVVAHLT